MNSYKLIKIFVKLTLIEVLLYFSLLNDKRKINLLRFLYIKHNVMFQPQIYLSHQNNIYKNITIIIKVTLSEYIHKKLYFYSSLYSNGIYKHV